MASLSNVGKDSVNKVTKYLGKVPKADMFGFALGAGIETISSIKQGKGIGESLFRGAAMGVVENVIGGWSLLALSLAPVAPSLARGYLNWQDKLNSKYRARTDPANMSFSYSDTEQAYTMRQAAIQAIQGSKLNARSALGGEARLMHRGIPGR